MKAGGVLSAVRRIAKLVLNLPQNGRHQKSAILSVISAADASAASGVLCDGQQRGRRQLLRYPVRIRNALRGLKT